MDATTGEPYYGAQDDPHQRLLNPKIVQKRKKPPKYRSPEDRPALISRLVAWRRRVSARHGPFHSASFILDDKKLAKLATLHPKDLSNHEQVTILLGETADWGNEWSKSIFDLILAYDNELQAIRPVGTQKSRVKRTKQ